MKRVLLLSACLILVLTTAPALAKERHRKPNRLGPVVTVTANGDLVSGAGSVSTAVANCPAGTRVFGGGFSLAQGDPQTTAVFESYRSAPGSWTVSVLTSGPDSGAAAAYGYCRRSANEVTEVTASSPVAVGLGQPGSASASCPAGTRLVAGGFQSTFTPGTRFVSLPQTSMSSSTSTWSVASLNNGAHPQTLSAHAYCLLGIRAPTIVSAETSATLSQNQTLTATSPECPLPQNRNGKRKRRQLLSAGGFSTPARTTEPFVLFTSSLADPSGWTATADNVTPTPGTFSVTGQGICV